MLEQVSNFDQDIKFIVGFAGSGKSTRLSSDSKETTLTLTPTHKAGSVLVKKGVQNVCTIHSALSLVPMLNQNFRPGQRMQKLSQIGKVDLSTITDVFIDEFSMINTQILDMLLALLPAEAKVTVFGDPYQLPPVSGEAVDPYMYTDNVEELTIQHRSEAPEIVETFMRFVEYIKTGKAMNLKLNPLIKKGTLDNFNPETDRALAFTNKKVLSINAKIAKILNLPKTFSEGVDLVANSIECTYNTDGHIDYTTTIFPTCISKGSLMDDTSLQIASQKTLNDIEKYGTDLSEWSTASVIIDEKVYNLYYDADHYHTSLRLKKQVESAQFAVIKKNELGDDVNLTQWCKENRNAEGVKERGFAWSRYIAHSNLVFALSRPFATTVHKSQGSEFRTVYIAQEDIKRSIVNGYYMTYARLMYVALSRAIHKVIIID